MLAPLARAAPTPDAMRQAAQRFEAQVFAQLLQPAFEGLGQGGFGGGAAEAQWRPMLVEGFAAAAARAGRGIGLQEMVLRHMIRLQEQSSSHQENRP